MGFDSPYPFAVREVILQIRGMRNKDHQNIGTGRKRVHINCRCLMTGEMMKVMQDKSEMYEKLRSFAKRSEYGVDDYDGVIEFRDLPFQDLSYISIDEDLCCEYGRLPNISQSFLRVAEIRSMDITRKHPEIFLGVDRGNHEGFYDVVLRLVGKESYGSFGMLGKSLSEGERGTLNMTIPMSEKSQKSDGEKSDSSDCVECGNVVADEVVVVSGDKYCSMECVYERQGSSHE